MNKVEFILGIIDDWGINLNDPDYDNDVGITVIEFEDKYNIRIMERPLSDIIREIIGQLP